jgi:hypothetical protein
MDSAERSARARIPHRAAQMLACHDTAMGCFRDALAANKPSRLFRDYLNQAGKLSRTFAMLLDALNRHRGKGMQKITVEHVHVHTGGQTIVGSVSQSGGGGSHENRGQPHAPENAGAITFAPGTTLPSAHKAREALPVASGRQ